MLNCRYIPRNQWDERWGLTIRSLGYQQIAPGDDYPPVGHDTNYIFNPEEGRVLNEYQIIYIIEGQGQLETRSGGKHRIGAGDAFILFPGEWHTYFPDKGTGWTEYWIGFIGENIDTRVEREYFSKENPVYKIGYNELVVNLLDKAIVTSYRQEPYFQQSLAGVVNYILGVLVMSSGLKDSKESEKTLETINKAKSIMVNMIGEAMDMAALADKVGMSYPNFRKTFKAITGKSPSQYLIDMRLHYAQEMLRETRASIKDIAISVGYNNIEHFSTIFRKRFGMSPTEFKSRNTME